MVDVTFGRNASYAAADTGDYARLRLYQIPWRPMKNATYILPRVPAAGRPEMIAWEQPTSTSLPGFSAVCWYFGKVRQLGRYLGLFLVCFSHAPPTHTHTSTITTTATHRRARAP